MIGWLVAFALFVAIIVLAVQNRWLRRTTQSQAERLVQLERLPGDYNVRNGLPVRLKTQLRLRGRRV